MAEPLTVKAVLRPKRPNGTGHVVGEAQFFPGYRP